MNITATILEITLESKDYCPKPYPKFLHGICYQLAGKDYPHIKHKPPGFHPYIEKWSSGREYGTKGVLCISVVDECLLLSILHSLQSTQTLRVGSNVLTIQKYETIKTETISLFPDTEPPEVFKVQFITPTTFRERLTQKYRSKATFNLTSFIRSTARNLHLLYKVQMSLEEQEAIIEKLFIQSERFMPIQAKIDIKERHIDCFVGEVQLSTGALSSEEKKRFGMLLKVAKYTGVGFKKGYGFGHIQIKRPAI